MTTIRAAIIEAVGTGCGTVSAIAAATKLTPTQVSNNLSLLKSEGIVTATHAGLTLAPGQRMPVKTIDPKDYERAHVTPAAPTPSSACAAPVAPSSPNKSNGAAHSAPEPRTAPQRAPAPAPAPEVDELDAGAPAAIVALVEALPWPSTGPMSERKREALIRIFANVVEYLYGEDGTQ